MKCLTTFISWLLYCLTFTFCREFVYYDYEKIMDIFKDLMKTCPQYIRVDTSQRRYNISSWAQCGNRPCENLIVFMTDFKTYEVSRPQMYISGLLHGDEVLGATILTELALYFCKSPNPEPWVLELLKSRYLVFTPFTNSYGYYYKVRDELVFKKDGTNITVDPNRDFPYFNYQGSDPSPNCMQTATARTVNELMREHIFVNVITFHGGLNAIGYPWGNHIHKISDKKATICPDYTGARMLGEILQTYSSSQVKNTIPDYYLGDMIEMVMKF
jgi:hypothetical protein